MLTRCLIAAPLVALSLTGATRQQESGQIPLASIYTTSLQKELKRLPGEIKVSDPDRIIDRKADVFLVAGADIAAAVAASRPRYLTDPKNKNDKKDDTKIDVVVGKTPLWIVAYLGSTGSQPPQWIIESLEIKDKAIRVRYARSKANERTTDLRPYLYWAPVGMLRPGEYTLELYDADAKKAAVERKCRVEP
jgi:hypothetical protein